MYLSNTSDLIPKLFVGMDLHKNTSTFCVKKLNGDVITFRKIATDKIEVTDFINSLKAQSDNISLVLEPVSQWYYYADLLESLGVDVHLAHPMRVKAIASARIKSVSGNRVYLQPTIYWQYSLPLI